jgi:large conductance mechanosensitive channel
MLKGFEKFLLRGNILDLAVAVVIGVAFTALVQSLTKDIITPIIGIFGAVPDFGSANITINGSRILIGDFINAVLAFLVTAVALYFVIVAPMERLLPKVTTKECPFCLSKVPLDAKRCAFCTSDLTASPTVAAKGSTPRPAGAAASDAAAEKTAVEETEVEA